MLFNSLEFLIFLPIVVVIYYIVPNKVKNLWLLIASYYFYMCWNAKYAILIFISTMITYLSGILFDIVNKADWDDNKILAIKRTILATTIVLNLGILFYYKYINFAFDTIQKFFSLMHVDVSVPIFDVILPVGISFYTFQALGYSIDVYQGTISAERNFFKYALFVSFFPQLVAGPIERSGNLLNQLSNPRKFNFDDFREGILLILWGFFLKIVLADRIAIYVDTVYSEFTSYPGYYLIIATILFSIQIYCDFNGYSTIAMGAAKILRIDLMSNFNAPYLSTSVAEFWRNWHVSLTAWFRDYLYIPLGGSRKGRIRKYINIIVVFMASGIWHGAHVKFLLWGVINGFYQVLGELLMPIRNKMSSMLQLQTDSLGNRVLKSIVTSLLIDFSWIFFRAEGLWAVGKILKSIFTADNLWILFDGSIYQCGLDEKNCHLMLLCIFLLLIADVCKKKGIVVRNIILRQDFWVRWLIIAFAVWSIMLFGKWGPVFNKASFIYFQF